ncbi:type 1 glutamine amidotransferase [Novosphingobium sp. YAF33]|uniref:type 1 glutamine amidotransferase n=1 Tax=Novosphingobium sp. YAF33 TaxID=3233082 RepID=UPI003F97D456
MQFLVAESETRDQREARRERTGRSSGETFAETLRQIAAGAQITRIAPADNDAQPLSAEQIAAFDAVFITGSPLHVYEDSPVVCRQIAFVRAVFSSGTPAFGSCAGLQLAVAAAGGSIRPMRKRLEAGVARRIVPTLQGAQHPLLAGRPPVWDAAAIHSDEVEALPKGAILLAGNGATHVQAAEIRSGPGVFWGVQYHPELRPAHRRIPEHPVPACRHGRALDEVATALREQAASLVAKGIARNKAAVERHACLLEALHMDADDRSARWELGVDGEFALEECRRRELTNFIANISRLRGSPVFDCGNGAPARDFTMLV